MPEIHSSSLSIEAKSNWTRPLSENWSRIGHLTWLQRVRAWGWGLGWFRISERRPNEFLYSENERRWFDSVGYLFCGQVATSLLLHFLPRHWVITASCVHSWLHSAVLRRKMALVWWNYSRKKGILQCWHELIWIILLITIFISYAYIIFHKFWSSIRVRYGNIPGDLSIFHNSSNQQCHLIVRGWERINSTWWFLRLSYRKCPAAFLIVGQGIMSSGEITWKHSFRDSAAGRGVFPWFGWFLTLKT